MCARQECRQLGEPTTSRRCEVCGFVTVKYDEEGAARLRWQASASPADYERRNLRSGMPVSTSNDLPGWEVTDYLGEVFGVVVRSRGAFPQIGANLRAIVGGELGTMTNLLRDTRQQAIARLVHEAELRGADAVIAMRFDVTSMGGSVEWTEVCAYGTAVSASRVAGNHED